MLGRTVTSVERIGGGRNSTVYKVNIGDAGQYIAKYYFLDDRDRLRVEFSSLQFLWGNEVVCIPRPIMADRDRGCAVYEFIEGQRMPSDAVTESDVDYAVNFLAMLKDLKNAKRASELPPASEACFSVQAIISNIELRLSRLLALQHDEGQYRDLHDFLTDEFTASFDQITTWCKSSVSQTGTPFRSELPWESRTLSPSDFGFHNSLRREDGRIVFLDFEYFGWDDPAKMISDFLLHPAMELPEDLKQRFVADMLARVEDRGQLAGRLQTGYSLFGLKWCLILLNEYLPDHLLRREFADVDWLDKEDRLGEQMVKARAMLQRVGREHGHFKYNG